MACIDQCTKNQAGWTSGRPARGSAMGQALGGRDFPGWAGASRKQNRPAP